MKKIIACVKSGGSFLPCRTAAAAARVLFAAAILAAVAPARNAANNDLMRVLRS